MQFEMPSAVCFNLAQSKILSSVNGLIESIADDKMNGNEKLKLLLQREENIVGKGENAGY